jgi:lipopolysaccharide export system ATP-binding protein
MSILKAEGVTKAFNGRRVVDNVNLEIGGGEVVGLLGPNGAGKTTTFHMIVGFVRPDGGKVFLNGADMTSAPTYQRARAGISYLPQESSVFRRLTVEENLFAILETLDPNSFRWRAAQSGNSPCPRDLSILCPFG